MTHDEATHPRIGSLVCRADKREQVGIITRFDENASFVRWPDGSRWHRFNGMMELEIVPYTDYLPAPGEINHDPIAWRAAQSYQKNATGWG